MLTVSFIQYTKDYNWKYIDTYISAHVPCVRNENVPHSD